MRLNWFSPLPPAPTGIAEWTGHVLPALCAQAEVVLWTDQEPWEAVPGVAAEVRRFRPDDVPWAEVQRADLTVYHVGNNARHHAGICQVSRRHPGVVVLHDLGLPHLFLALYREQRQDRAGYRAELERFYGDFGGWLAPRLWDGRIPVQAVADCYPHTALAVEGALGVLVHTRAAYDALRPAMQWPLAYQPLAYRAAPHVPHSAEPGVPHRLVVFGHIDANRGLASVLEALARFGADGPFRLDVYGTVWDPEYVQGLVTAHGLRRRVTLHGYVSESELSAALARSHLALNLRNPTMGEASLSQLRIWEHSLPALVSQTGWYATLPPTAVAHVHPECEVEDLCRHLEAFLLNPAALARLGANGRLWLERHHAPESYVEALLRLCEEAVRYRPRAVSYYLARRAAEEMSLWGGRRAVALSEQVAGPIVSLTAQAQGLQPLGL
jgi:glycosyltransferase involved in cell wall biosynthesis